MEGGDMMIRTELERASALIDRATVRIASLSVEGRVRYIDTVDEGVDLVYTPVPFRRRAIGVPGRRLTTEFTTQPVIAIIEGKVTTPIVYGEDLINHPLRRNIEDRLINLSSFIPGG